jgi:2-isopropylmalate synthase
VTKIETYDATLRDGMQGEGMSLTAAEKVRVVHALDALGVDLIEAGFPASNPKEQELFELLSAEQLTHATVAAFGMTRRRGVAADQDPALKVLVDSFATVCTIVGKTWAAHLEKIVRVSREENLEMIADTVTFLRHADKRVIYDAEHFFDSYRDDPGYAISCLRAALDAGAERLVLCDTNGSSLPPQITEAVRGVREQLPEAALGIHCHNDRECGVANSLAAVAEGATQVQGTMNGIGERTGNANLVSIIANLELGLGYEVVGEQRLTKLTSTARLVDELLNRNPAPSQPWVGRSAFAHKGGMHVAGVRADAPLYEHHEPEAVGNQRALLISELAGKHTVLEKAEAAGISLTDEQAQNVVARVKELEHQGYQYEAADGSFELLLRRESGDYKPLVTLESWRVIAEQDASGACLTEATVKVIVDGERYVQTAEGNGPVNALDAALREAIVRAHPHLADVELVNYKVRILDEAHGTDAVTRVFIDASDGKSVWGSTGVAENVIAASWQALVDSLEYAEQTAVGPQR